MWRPDSQQIETTGQLPAVWAFYPGKRCLEGGLSLAVAERCITERGYQSGMVLTKLPRAVSKGQCFLLALKGGGAMNFPVVLINVYSVPKGKEEEFFLWWNEAKENARQAPGFISGKLHRSLQANARFNFINIAQWENDIYSQTYEKSLLSMNAKLAQLGIEMTPGLFMVHLEY